MRMVLTKMGQEGGESSSWYGIMMGSGLDRLSFC